jgi:hypothetical protein
MLRAKWQGGANPKPQINARGHKWGYLRGFCRRFCVFMQSNGTAKTFVLPPVLNRIAGANIAISSKGDTMNLSS